MVLLRKNDFTDRVARENSEGIFGENERDNRSGTVHQLGHSSEVQRYVHSQQGERNIKVHFSLGICDISVPTECFANLGKLNLLMVVRLKAQANFHYCRLPQLPKKTKLGSKVVKIDSKIIILLHYSKLVTHSVFI